MLAYRTPGVYLERPLARPSIRRLRTDIAGLVGIARRGPLHHPVRVESWQEFVAVFGGHTPQGFLAYAVEGFFANGGRTCWVVRVADPASARPAAFDLTVGGAVVGRLVATSPGTWGRELSVTAIGTSPGRFTLVIRSPEGGQELWRDLATDPASDRFIATVINPRTDPPSDRPVTTVINPRTAGSRLLRFCPAAGTPLATRLPVVEGRAEVRGLDPSTGDDGLATLTAAHFAGEGMAPDPLDPCATEPPSLRPRGLWCLEGVDEVSVVAMPDAIPRPRVEVRSRRPRPRCDVLPDGRPTPEPPSPGTGLLDHPPPLQAAEVAALQRELIQHCTVLRDRVAVLDVPPASLGGGDAPQAVLEWRRGFSTHWAAAYFPWVRVPERLDTGELLTAVPPSGHVAGAIARGDLARGVHTPPANQRLEGIEDVVLPLDQVEHGDLNDGGVNAIVTLAGRGIRVMGARTLDPAPDQRYLNVRRLLVAIQEALDEQTQWAVFEPSSPRLWREVDRVVRAYLLGLWRDGMLDGATADLAFSVVCDETTNPPEEIAAGRVICQVGILPPWPAEFVVVRLGIGQGGVELMEGPAHGGGG